jgi:hypothetical protein
MCWEELDIGKTKATQSFTDSNKEVLYGNAGGVH